jgi:hypothetical protein
MAEKKGLLGKLKSDGKKAARKPGDMPSMSDFEDDSIDLETGTIKVDDAPPEHQISTNEILQEVEVTAEKALIKGQAGQIYILDLIPIFNAMGTKAGEKSAQSLVRFCETLLARATGSKGTYNNDNNEKFLFQLVRIEMGGLLMASRIVHELGVNFLHGGFNAEELVSDVLSVVDAENPLDENGRIIVSKALAAPQLERQESDDPDDDGPMWVPIGEVKGEEEEPEWSVAETTDWPASQRVKRGPDRRRQKKPIAGRDRRENPKGRRENDYPNVFVW